MMQCCSTPANQSAAGPFKLHTGSNSEPWIVSSRQWGLLFLNFLVVNVTFNDLNIRFLTAGKLKRQTGRERRRGANMADSDGHNQGEFLFINDKYERGSLSCCN